MSLSARRYFIDLKEYVDGDIVVYGSILRTDYIEGYSDIDIAIFTENETSTITKLQHFLKVPKQSFRRIEWKLNGHAIHGNKIKYNKENKEHPIKYEISIYGTQFKPYLLQEYNRPSNWSAITLLLLYIIKYIHYVLGIINQSQYASLKRRIMNANVDSEFNLLL
jgi:predicted nucleotidyltransferase